MQYTVNEKIKEHLIFGVSEFSSIVGCPIRADYYIAQKVLLRRGVSFELGKGQDVGGAFFTSILEVQFSHLGGVDQHNGKDGIRVTAQVF